MTYSEILFMDLPLYACVEVHVPNFKLKKMATDIAKQQRKALLGDEDATMVFETSKGVNVVPTFDGMNLREDLLRGIYAYGMILVV